MKENNRIQRVRESICNFMTEEMLWENDNHKKAEIILKREKIMQDDNEFIKALDYIEDIARITKQLVIENKKEREEER